MNFLLRELLNDHQEFHSELQMDAFITRKSGGTVYGCYKQALRELDGRFKNLRNLYLQRHSLRMDRVELERAMTRDSSGRVEVELLRNDWAQQDLDAQIRDIEREFCRFYCQASGLKRQIGELTESRRAELDLEMWIYRIKCMAAVDYITRGILGEMSVTMCQSLPPGRRSETIATITDGRDELVKWFTEHESVCLENMVEEERKTLPSVRDIVCSGLLGGRQEYLAMRGN